MHTAITKLQKIDRLELWKSDVFDLSAENKTCPTETLVLAPQKLWFLPLDKVRVSPPIGRFYSEVF